MGWGFLEIGFGGWEVLLVVVWFRCLVVVWVGVLVGVWRMPTVAVVGVWRI